MFFNCGSTTIKAQFRGSVLLRETFLTVGFFKCSSLRSARYNSWSKTGKADGFGEKKNSSWKRIRQQLYAIRSFSFEKLDKFWEKTATEIYQIFLS